MTIPKVSICMITYNHEKFIEQAIESVLMQQADFDYELVIGEDCSTDGTRAIVDDYRRRYPDKIRAFLREKNLGMQENGMQTLAACHGEYLALSEGDDYWIDSAKLQKQVDFLDSHPECSMVFTAAKTLHGCELTDWDPPPVIRETYTLDDILARNFICTPTVMYRNCIKGDLPGWFRQMRIGDWPLHILHAMQGNIGYLHEPTAVYRVHSNGAWSSLGVVKRLETSIATSRQLMQVLPGTCRKALQRGICIAEKQIVSYCLVWGNEPSAGRRYVFMLLLKGQWPFESFGQALRAMVWFICPSMGRRLQKRRARQRVVDGE